MISTPWCAASASTSPPGASAADRALGAAKMQRLRALFEELT
jgi:hypothetical protein